MGITELIAHYATQTIDMIGYGGVFVLMILESMVFPVPSEAVLPFAGFLVVEGRFTFVSVVIVSTFASIVGSLLSYAMGRYGGVPFIERYGAYFLVSAEDLHKTADFFERRGEVTIFFSRFIPVVRHLISIPAGMGRMRLSTFMLYTALGAGLWNAFLVWCGVLLEKRWGTLMEYSHFVDMGVVAILVFSVGFFFVKHVRGRRVGEGRSVSDTGSR